MPSKPKYDIPTAFHSPPAFIESLMHSVRVAAEKESGMRIRVDMSAKTVVSLTGQWNTQHKRDIPRRVFVETKLDEGRYSLMYMTKAFDENAVQRHYPSNQVEAIQKDILQFLNIGRLPTLN